MTQHEPVRYVVDATATGVTVLALLQYLPPIAALFSIVWIGIQIYEWYKKKRKP